MKSLMIRLTGKQQVDYAAKMINECLDQPELWCVDIKKHKEAKTMQQLRGLFGTWYTYLSEMLGETKDDLHKFHKAGEHGEGGWLADIYITAPQNKKQEMWVELLDFYNGSYKVGAHVTHIYRISLSWATVDQMREYMNRIEHYYMNAGYPLPILEKFQRAYTR